FPATGTWLGDAGWPDIKIDAYGLDPAACNDLAREFNILSHHVTQPPGTDQNGRFSGENWVFMADASALTPADQELLCRLLVKTAPPAPLLAINASGKATSPLLRRASAVAPSSGEISRQFVYTVLNWHRRHIPRSASPQ